MAWSMVSPRPLVAILVFAVLGAAVLGAPADLYEHHCNTMISASKLAAARHNAGDVAGAEAQIARVRAAFLKAKRLDPDHPQAFLNYAIFLSNTHKYEEAIKMFDDALARLGSDDHNARMQVMQASRKTKYDHASMKRDATYANGNGNLFEAHSWAEQQLMFTREPHRIQHDLATLEIMLCENNATFCDLAQQRLQSAAITAFQRFTLANTPESPKLRMQCLHSHLHVGSWAGHPGNVLTTITIVEGLYIHNTLIGATLLGRDGIVQLKLDGDCSLLSPASDYYPNLADNLEPQRPFPVEIVEDRVINLVKFSGHAFYHWMCEIIPALVVAKLHMPDFAEYSLLVPAADASGALPSFIRSSLFDLFSEWNISASRVIAYVPNLLLDTGFAAVTWDEQPCPSSPPAAGEQRGDDVSGDDPSALLLQRRRRFGCAALPHPHALRLGRAEIHKALGPLRVPPLPGDKKEYNADTEEYVLLALRGANVTMRNFDEAGLHRHIVNFLVSAAGLPALLGVRTFDASEYSFEEALQLFRGAAIVVGAHGGALSNIIACRPGTPVVEIGFETKAAQHYHHVALSLELPYRRVRVEPDENGRGLGASTIKVQFDDVLKEIYAAINAHFSERPATNSADRATTGDSEL